MAIPWWRLTPAAESTSGISRLFTIICGIQIFPPRPSLFDVSKDGRKTPALAVISKNALMFILNRHTGEPIHGIEERPVARGDIRGYT